MSAHGFDCSPHPCQRVPGFSNTSQQAIRAGIAVLGDAAAGTQPNATTLGMRSGAE
jgi:hypothetical protein